MGPGSVWRSWSWPWPGNVCRSQGKPSPRVLQSKEKLYQNCNQDHKLRDIRLMPNALIICSISSLSSPGSVFDPGLHCSPLALMTSTSRCPLWSLMESWMSPSAGEARTCLPTSCPGPNPSMNSDSWPSEPRRAEDVSQLCE